MWWRLCSSGPEMYTIHPICTFSHVHQFVFRSFEIAVCLQVGVCCQLNGVTIFNDARHLALRHVNSKMKKDLGDLTTKRIPLRIGLNVLVRPPTFIRIVLAIIRPFLGAKLRKRMIAVMNVADLEKDFDTAMIPADLYEEFNNPQ
eukprot:Platyproteum_vivax@DN6544_c0_g1_i2.p2